MNEKTLLKLALMVSLVGILFLLIILNKLEVPNTDINTINKEFLDKQVRVAGEIIRITETPGLYIINVRDNTGNIDVIVFKEEELNLEKGNIVRVEGQVTEYQNKMEIISKKIAVL